MPTLNWIGKEAVVNHHLQVPFHLLKDVPSPSACGEPGDGNLIVQGTSWGQVLKYQFVMCVWRLREVFVEIERVRDVVVEIASGFIINPSFHFQRVFQGKVGRVTL